MSLFICMWDRGEYEKSLFVMNRLLMLGYSDSNQE